MSLNVETEVEKPLFGIVPCIGSCYNVSVCCTLTFWKNLLTSRLVLVAVYFIFCMYINCVSQVYVQHRAWEYFNHDLQNATVLPDIGFDIFPHITENAIGSMNWADFITYAIMASTLIRFIFGITREGHRLRGHILRRHIFALGTLFLLRAFAILSTLLPNPLDGCEETLGLSEETLGKNPWIEGWRILGGQVVTCADVMYSGHTVNITLCAMTWHTYSHVVPLTKFDPICALRFGRSVTDTDLPPVRNEMGEALRWTSLKIIVWIVAGVGYVLIIATHFHYTLDVFIGAILAIVVFKFYLSYVRTAHLRDNNLNRFLVWLEDGADDILEYRRNLPKMYDAHARFVRSKTLATGTSLGIVSDVDDEEKTSDSTLESV